MGEIIYKSCKTCQNSYGGSRFLKTDDRDWGDNCWDCVNFSSYKRKGKTHG